MHSTCLWNSWSNFKANFDH